LDVLNTTLLVIPRKISIKLGHRRFYLFTYWISIVATREPICH